ncbi:MAG: glycosyltransferase family 2 protein [Candidatus Glassbacteria bacterium]|nr:glycosyltransferase family 2 protein [Candidatus Glassbacteria bacterium]
MKLSVIIPVFNEKATIVEVIDQVNRVPIEKEIIIVDDGSTDGTVEAIKKKEHEVTKVHLSRINFGKGAAVRVGLTYVTGDVVIIQDADTELDPREYIRLIAEIERGADVVYGSRFLKPDPHVSLVTRLANKFLTGLTNLLFGGDLTDMECAYKMFRTEVARRLSLRCIGFEFEPEITAQFLSLGYKIVQVPITYNPRKVQQGKKINWRDGVRAIWYLFFYRFTMKKRFRQLKKKKAAPLQ